MSLQQDLDELERLDPKVREARRRYDEAIHSLIQRARIEPVMKLAKKQAMLALIEQEVISKDQDALTATLVVARRRGNEITGEEVSEIVMRQDHDVQHFWTGTCPCGRSLD